MLTLGLAQAEIKMPSIFSDNMVLQQGMPIAVWGKAEPNAAVSVKFAGAQAEAKADALGKWRAELPALKANSSPAVMEILEDGKAAFKISNVLVGEVWVTGGQSNMAFLLRSCDTAKEATARANYPLIRYFNQRGVALSETPQEDFAQGAAAWLETTPETAGDFNCVAFFFAERLNQELKIPVGIISTAHGSAPMRTWLPRDEMEKSDNFKGILADDAKRMKDFDYDAEVKKQNELNAKYENALAKAKTEGAKAPSAPKTGKYNPSYVLYKKFPEGFRSPSALYNGKIAPLAGYTVRGILWYQFEADSYGVSLETSDLQLEGFIEIWRKLFGNEETPFIFVQLPSFGKVETWNAGRENQTKAYQNTPNSYMVVTLDTGDKDDIHPKDKYQVGLRAGNVALGKVYKQPIPYPLSPMFKSAKYKGESALINYETGGRNLVFKGEPKGFEVLVGGKWVEGMAKLKNGKLTVCSKDGAQIEGVRYAYAAYAKDIVSLFNEDGLPAAPFIDLNK